jgi:formylglycine-generating enzyme required for sulfatase activity
MEENSTLSQNNPLTLDTNFDSTQLNSQKQEEVEPTIQIEEEKPIEEEEIIEQTPIEEKQIEEEPIKEQEQIEQVEETPIEIEEESIVEEEIPQPMPIMTENQKFSIKGIDFNMVFVKGSTFKMGDGVEKTVGDYYICETAVTQALWIAVMETNPSWFEDDNFPVENISWEDASEFVRRLSELTGKTFRLPSEAEWEFAAKGGIYSKGYQYSGSNELELVAWYKDNSSRKTHAVKTKLPNELGLYDMSGNVYEWCDDWIDNHYKILRGGCWGSTAKGCLITNRFDSSPSTKGGDGGVRIAMSI